MKLRQETPVQKLSLLISTLDLEKRIDSPDKENIIKTLNNKIKACLEEIVIQEHYENTNNEVITAFDVIVESMYRSIPGKEVFIAKHIETKRYLFIPGQSHLKPIGDLKHHFPSEINCLVLFKDIDFLITTGLLTKVVIAGEYHFAATPKAADIICTR